MQSRVKSGQSNLTSDRIEKTIHTLIVFIFFIYKIKKVTKQ